MEFFADVPYIVRILLSLAAILAFQKLTKRLDFAMLAGALLLGAMEGHSAAAIAEIALGRVATLNSLTLAAVVTGVIWLSDLMSAAGVMRDLVAALRTRLGRRSVFAALPALVGLLPMPGGALFSCPLLDDADEEHVLRPVMKTKINYWFRHVWEFCWPLYPGFLLAVALTGLPVWKLMALMFPMYLAAIGAGAFFLLRGTAAETHADPGEPAAKQRAFLPLIFPILTIVLVYALVLALFPAVGRAGTYLPMLLGVVAALCVLCVQRPVPAAAWRKAALSPKWPGLAAIIVLAQMYSAFIEAELPGGGALMDGVRGELAAYGIPSVILVALLPFVSGLTTGITIGYIGASLPVVLSLAPEGAAGQFSAIALGFGCGFIGMILSPVHVCLIVTNQYFKTGVAESLTGLVKPAAALFCAVAAYAAFWRFLAG